MSRPFPKVQCCPHFTDYYDPNEWYTLFCNWAGSNVGFANFGSISGYRYFWDAGLDTVLNGTMINYQWLPSHLTQTTTTWTFTQSYDFVSDFTRTIYIVPYNIGDPIPVEADYTAHTIDFTQNRLRLTLADTCTGIPSTTNVAGKNARRFIADWFATIGSGTLTVSQNTSVASPYNGRSNLYAMPTGTLTSPTNDDTVVMTMTGGSRNNMNTTIGNFPLPIGLSGIGQKTSKSGSMTC